MTVFSNETTVVYASHSDLPESELKVSATVTDGMVAIMSGANEFGDVYRASVTENTADATQNDIVWKKLGNQNTVEGALELFASITPNTPITEQEIVDLFNA